MLLLPEGQPGEAWESSKKQQSSLCYDSDCVAMNEVTEGAVERLDAVSRSACEDQEKHEGDQ